MNLSSLIGSDCRGATPPAVRGSSDNAVDADPNLPPAVAHSLCNSSRLILRLWLFCIATLVFLLVSTPESYIVIRDL